jgi:putative transcriptional regulator
MDTSTNLRGHLLIAMPGLNDPNFDHTVTYILEHNEGGAFGLIINRPIDLDMSDVMQQLSITSTSQTLNLQPVLLGGPVQPERGFVLHRSNTELSAPWDSSAAFADGISVTTSSDILEALAAGNGPDPMLFILGYAGWDAGQLETEISDNAWLSVAATPEILFETPLEDRWEASARLLGVDPASISPVAGHA